MRLTVSESHESGEVVESTQETPLSSASFDGRRRRMRPAGRGPLDSLYFDYPHFAAKPVSDRGHRQPVVIVGAGPIGMTAALTLARYGVRSVLLDRKDTFNDGSRATCIARPSMQIFDRIGAVAPFVEKALPWRYGRSYYGDRMIFRLDMPDPPGEKYRPMYNMQQQYTEKFLHDAIERSDLIDMRWQSEVVAISQDKDHVTLRVTTPVETYDMEAAYCLASDGARSPLRGMLGLRLKGDNHEGRYVIADVQMNHDFPTERRAFFEPKGNPGGTVLVHRQPDNLWRIDYQLKPGESEEEALTEANIRTRVTAILGDLGHEGAWALEWWSIYSANTLCLDDYRRGRVFFVGDSAHIVPIFGVRGLNNGLADAHNIGWKLAYVLTGTAGPRLLDSYTPERRGATLDVFANAGKSTRFMTPPSRGWRIAREAALSLSLTQEFTRGLANPRQMQPYTYAQSPLTPFPARDAAFTAGPSCGSATPNAGLADGGHLLDHAGDGSTLLVFGEPAARDGMARVLAMLRERDRHSRVVTIGPPGIPDPDGEIARIYGAEEGTVYLLRPDLHIAGRWRVAVPDEIARTLDACLGGEP
jgi:3-(3-hydroxy-phenyl)propionate hydroxylase